MQQITNHTQRFNQNVALLCKLVARWCIIRWNEGESCVSWMRAFVARLRGAAEHGVSNETVA